MYHLSNNFIFRFTEEEHKKPGMAKRYYVWFMLGQLIGFRAIIWGYKVYGGAFVNVPQEYQWIVALFSPLVLEISIKVKEEIFYGAAGERLKSISYHVTHFAATKQTIFLAVLIGGVATEETSICLMVLEFGLIMFSGLNIIRKYRMGLDVEGT